METRRSLSAEAEALDRYDKPSVAVARQWLQSVILPRRIRNRETGSFRMVEMGEAAADGELFPVWGTSLRDLSVFGIGISLYFRMLVQLGALLFVLSLVSLPTVLYFLSDAYSGVFADRRVDGDKAGAHVDPRIWGTAVCTRMVLTEATDASGERMVAHDCPVKQTQMYIDLIILVVLVGYVIVSGIVQEKLTTLIDDDQQTAADYSVIVKDPDADAWDPDEWQIFFSQFGQVKFVTVAVDNHLLLRALAHKRYMEEMLRMESADEEAVRFALKTAKHGPPPPSPAERGVPLWKRIGQRLTFFRGLHYWHYQLYKHRQYIGELLRREKTRGFPVWTVFVMFESEASQRRCLREMSAGICSTVCDSRYSDVPERVRFRGSNILRVEDPMEPTSVLWKYVGVSRRNRLLQQVGTVGIVASMMVGVFFLLKWMQTFVVTDPDEAREQRRENAYILAYTLTFTDIFGCKILAYTHYLEHHQSKEREQLSYLNKLLLFRAFNSAVVIYLLMDFTDILAPYNLLQVQAILIANLTTTPVLQLLSLYNRVCLCLFAPHAKTQKKLNLYYSGTYWQLAERYTEITKAVGVALFFKPILPTGLAITSLSLVVNYWVDKYCLLRKWKVPPLYDGLLARASRYHLLLISMAALIMMGHWYNGWPYDTRAEVAMQDVKFQLEEAQEYFGLELSHVLNLFFPFPRRDYVFEDQKKMMSTVNLLIMSITAAALVWLVLRIIYKAWIRLVTGKNSSAKRYQDTASDIPSSDVPNLHAYVPSYESWYSDFPYLCVDLSDFDTKYISWTGDYNDYSLVADVKGDSVLRTELESVRIEKIFGACKQYHTDSSNATVAARGGTMGVSWRESQQVDSV